jgi:ubiquinone/menaquinone biosynthesis C-methylase UbiE
MSSILLRLRNWLLRHSLFNSTILPAIPRPIRWALRRIYFLPIDVLERVSGSKDPMTPPKSRIFTGGVEGFGRSGDRLVERLVEVTNLAPNSRILDVGSGIGRLAVPLTRYLDRAGSYEGLDIVPTGIQWCKENITPSHPNFRFTLADVHNSEYNPGGRLSASEYVFPYPDDHFDIAILLSVFTHMLPPDVERYVSEISRVLVRGGQCVATSYLINDESLELMNSGRSSKRFRYHHPPYWLANAKVPEFSVAYDEEYVQELYETHGFAEPHIHFGGWCGRDPFWSKWSGPGDQDLVIAVKGT